MGMAYIITGKAWNTRKPLKSWKFLLGLECLEMLGVSRLLEILDFDKLVDSLEYSII